MLRWCPCRQLARRTSRLGSSSVGRGTRLPGGGQGSPVQGLRGEVRRRAECLAWLSRRPPSKSPRHSDRICSRRLDAGGFVGSCDGSQAHSRAAVPPLKLTIPGRYWDSQICRGRLHLFGMEGDVLTLDWDALIGKLRVRDDLKLAARSAFQRSDFLYGVASTGIFRDPEIRRIISHRFHDLSQVPLEPSQQEIDQTALGRQDNLFPFPHADSEIYNRRLYVSSRAGVFAANCGGSTKYPVSTSIARLSEMPVSAVRASYRSLALAAGEEGLWQYDLDDFRDGSRTERVASQHCSECQWAFHSIYGSSSTGAGVLASYLKRREQAEWTEREEWRRTLDRVIPDSEIFAGFEDPDGRVLLGGPGQDLSGGQRFDTGGKVRTLEREESPQATWCPAARPSRRSSRIRESRVVRHRRPVGLRPDRHLQRRDDARRMRRTGVLEGISTFPTLREPPARDPRRPLGGIVLQSRLPWSTSSRKCQASRWESGRLALATPKRRGASHRSESPTEPENGDRSIDEARVSHPLYRGWLVVARHAPELP